MKYKFLLAAFTVILFSNAHAQQWISYDASNNPPEPSLTISELAFKGDTTWIGTVEFGLGWSTDDIAWNVLDSSNSDLPDNHINALAFDHEGNLWIGADKNLVKYDGTNWTVYNNANTPVLPNLGVRSIAFDPDNNVWVGFTVGGVAKFDGADWTLYTADSSGLPHNGVRGIAAQSNGDVWIATGSGAGRFNGSTWTAYDIGNTALVNHDFMSIAIDSLDNVWFGTSGGAAKFDGATWTSYTPLNTLAFNDPVVSLTCDATGNVWFATMATGIVKYDGTAFTEYNMSNTMDTLPSNEFMAALTNPCSNDVYFGSTGGLAIYDDLMKPDCAATTYVNDIAKNDFSISALQNPGENGLVELVCNVTTFGNYQIVLTDILGREIYSNVVSLNSGVTVLPVQLSDDGFFVAMLRNNISASTTKLILK